MIDDEHIDGTPSHERPDATERERVEAEVVQLVVSRGAAADRGHGPIAAAIEAETRRRTTPASSVDPHATRRIATEVPPSPSRPPASPPPSSSRTSSPKPSTSHRGRSTGGRRGDPRASLVLRATRLAHRATPRVAKRLTEISERAAEASRDELGALSARLTDLELRVDRAERRKAVRAVQRADRVAARSGGSRALDAAREDLRAAVIGGKLPEIVACRERLEAELGPAPLHERREVLAAGAVIVLVIAVVVLLLTLGGADTGRVRVFLPAPSTKVVDVEVRQGEAVVGREQIEAGAEQVEFDLAPGFYEIFIDGRSFGDSVHVFRPGVEIDVPVTGTP
jgi:hypothetical protein